MPSSAKTSTCGRLAEKYPEIKLIETLVSDEDQAKAQQLTRDALSVHPDPSAVWGIISVTLPGAATAVGDAGKSGKALVTGLSLLSTAREFIKDGTAPKIVLWNAVDLGYLTVHAGKLLADKQLAPGVHKIGRLENIQVGAGSGPDATSEVPLGPPLIFERANIDQFDFQEDFFRNSGRESLRWRLTAAPSVRVSRHWSTSGRFGTIGDSVASAIRAARHVTRRDQRLRAIHEPASSRQ